MTNTAATVTYSTPLGGEARVVLRRAILHAKMCPEDSVYFEAAGTAVAVKAETTVVGVLKMFKAKAGLWADSLASRPVEEAGPISAEDDDER